MTDLDKLKQIDKDNLSPLYMIYGEDEDVLNEIKDKILEKINFSPDDLSQSLFDLTETDSDYALEELESLPFFDDQRIVIYENLWDISTVKKSVFDDKQLERFEAYIDSPVDTTVLIIFIHGKLDNKRRIVKKLKQKAIIFEANQLKEAEQATYFNNYAKSLGVNISPSVMKRILEKSAFTFGLVKKNIDLLKMYKADKEVTLDDVELVLPKTLQDNIFDLTDFLLKGKVNEARDLVDDLILQGEDEIKLLAILMSNFRLYYKTKLLQMKGATQQQIAEQLKIHPYRVKLAMQAVNKLSPKMLRLTMLDLIELDYKMKSGYANKNYMFDIEIIKIALNK